MKPYTREDVIRFIEQANSRPYDSPDDEAIKAAGAFLLDMLADVKNGASPKRRFTYLGFRKLRQNKFTPASATIDTAEFAIVCELVDGKVSYGEAKQKLAELHPASERQLESWIAAIRPRAERFSGFVDWLKRSARRG